MHNLKITMKGTVYMDKWLQPVLAFSLLAAFNFASAVTVYECVDAEGEVTFQDSCPPGTELAGTKQLSSNKKVEAVDIAGIAAQNPVVLYGAPACADACDLVRNQLQKRNVPFSEVDVTAVAAEQLPADVASEDGTVTVPTVTVADQRISGYSKSELDTALNGAGYPDGEAPAED